jgi:hypothetical protein
MTSRAQTFETEAEARAAYDAAPNAVRLRFDGIPWTVYVHWYDPND